MKSIVTVVAVLIAATYGQQEECPQGAEFIISFDNVVQLADLFQNIPDPDLSFFRDVLRFTEQEIETATQSAIEYFNTTGRLYSLDWWTGVDWTGLDWTGLDWTHPKICKMAFSV